MAVLSGSDRLPGGNSNRTTSHSIALGMITLFVYCLCIITLGSLTAVEKELSMRTEGAPLFLRSCACYLCNLPLFTQNHIFITDIFDD